MVCAEDAKTLATTDEENRIINSLTGLNMEFDQVRIQILEDRLRPINEVFAFAREEESRRVAMTEWPDTDGSTMATVRRGEDNEGSSTRGQRQQKSYKIICGVRIAKSNPTLKRPASNYTGKNRC